MSHSEERLFELEVAMSELASDLRRVTSPPQSMRWPDLRQRARARLSRSVQRHALDPWAQSTGVDHDDYNAVRQQVGDLGRETDFAVVVHLYYPEMWPTHFAPALSRLDPTSYTLFVTVPPNRPASHDQVRASHPEAVVLNIPNRGRDVLPFVVVADALADAGYPYLLKLHSKRSPKRVGGDTWMRDILAKLLPHDDEALSEVTTVMSRPQTSLIGPAGHYLPLAVESESQRANAPKVEQVLSSAGVLGVDDVTARPFHHGFFQGTMFWARLDYLLPLCRLEPHDFEPEGGQLDATLAHGWERAAGALSAVLDREIYTCDGHVVTQILHRTSAVPEWSDYYRGVRAPSPYHQGVT